VCACVSVWVKRLYFGSMSGACFFSSGLRIAYASLPPPVGSHDSRMSSGALVLTFSNLHRFKRHQIAHLSKVLTFEKPGLRPDEEARMSLRRGGGSWAII
jgi:hypothetical protein